MRQRSALTPSRMTVAAAAAVIGASSRKRRSLSTTIFWISSSTCLKYLCPPRRRALGPVQFHSCPAHPTLYRSESCENWLGWIGDIGNVRGNTQALRQTVGLAEPLGFRQRL